MLYLIQNLQCVSVFSIQTNEAVVECKMLLQRVFPSLGIIRVELWEKLRKLFCPVSVLCSFLQGRSLLNTLLRNGSVSKKRTKTL